MLFDERRGRRLIVHGKRRGLDAAVSELGAQPLERSELCVAVGTPSSAIDQDNLE